MKTPKPKLKSCGYPVFSQLLQSLRVDAPVPEYQFAADRKWRFDFAWPNCKLALEIEGGAWVGGRHNRPSGFIKDMEKYNRAASEGWRILRVTPQNLLKSETIELIQKSIT